MYRTITNLSVKIPFLVLTFLTILTAQTSCTKSTSDSDPAHVEPMQTGLQLKSTAWSNTAVEVFTYDPEGTLVQTLGSLQNSGGHTRKFTYQSKKIIEVLKDDIKRNKFSYDQAGRIIRITEATIGDDHNGLRLDFTYDSGSALRTVKYYQFDEFKDVLKATSVYEYDAKGALQKATVLYAGHPDQKLEYSFESYSSEVRFNPWALLDFWDLIQRDYTFYNYPLLSSTSRLPKRFTITYFLNNKPQQVTTKGFEYTISNKQIQKINYVTDNVNVVFNY